MATNLVYFEQPIEREENVAVTVKYILNNVEFNGKYYGQI